LDDDVLLQDLDGKHLKQIWQRNEQANNKPPEQIL
jgi:hypothetical protein